MAGKHEFSMAGKHGQRAARKRELYKRGLHMLGK